MSLLEDKIALVVGAGAAGNMGDAIARRYAHEGARVVVVGRKPDHLVPLARDIGGTHALCDITSEAEVEALAGRIRALHGRLDILANAAGVTMALPLSDANEEEMDWLFRTNLYGPVYLIKHMAPLVGAGGTIIMVSSTGALPHNNSPTRAIYNASKAALNRLVQAAAVEYGDRGIRINAIAPGLVLTPMADVALKDFGTELIDRMMKRTPLGRIATAEDIAAMATYLASDEYFDTGQIVQANGGYSLLCGGPAGA